MKLRGRFTLTLVLTALVPIAIAVTLTRFRLAASYRADYQAERENVRRVIEGEVKRLGSQVADAVASLARRDHPFVGKLLLDYLKGADYLRSDRGKDDRRRLNEAGKPVMEGLSLDVLKITDPDDVVLVTPHYRPDLAATDTDVRVRATDTRGKPYFAREQVTRERVDGATVSTSKESILVAEAARTAHDAGFSIPLLAGRQVGPDLLSTVRRAGRVDARIVWADGTVIVPPLAAPWPSSATIDGEAGMIVVDLVGPALGNKPGERVASIQVVVSDGGLEDTLWNTTLISIGIAAGSLVVVIGIGLLVARRTVRDLDRLVEGSLAAARGDLDHRVPVRGDDEVAAVATSFNLMMEDLQTSKERLVIAERIAAWQEIARRLAHEIKNPLTQIQMAMDTLRKTWRIKHPKFDEILEESTTTVQQEADRLKSIVTEFSDFARMPKPEFHRIELDELVRSSLALYQGAVPIELALGGVPAMDGDKHQLTQVILNLVENARDALTHRGDPTTGKIVVSTRAGETADRVVLMVEDNGPGVPHEVKDKVFAPYFTTKHAKGGTGLGLAIVHRIVSDHGGRITITDAPTGGARFVIELPLRNGTALLASRI
ncbi:MAG: ATP-binding protein [Proteobacteria bacterium]|nr:ATP-binding protein [Pseudomonadota bacterium]